MAAFIAADTVPRDAQHRPSRSAVKPVSRTFARMWTPTAATYCRPRSCLLWRVSQKKTERACHQGGEHCAQRDVIKRAFFFTYGNVGTQRQHEGCGEKILLGVFFGASLSPHQHLNSRFVLNVHIGKQYEPSSLCCVC